MEIHDEKTYFIQPCCSEECLTTQRGSGDPFLYLKTRKLFCTTGECNTNSSATDDQYIAKDFFSFSSRPLEASARRFVSLPAHSTICLVKPLKSLVLRCGCRRFGNRTFVWYNILQQKLWKFMFDY
ncbi:hypothetical protein TNCV_3202531 [Trichonephila clavipes]|nr:hypothetical protein TNCV_3202531 [Trichonephila clavipes]